MPLTVLSFYLSDTGEFALADMINRLGIVTILLTLVQSTLSLHLYDHRDERAISRWLDHVSFAVMLIGFLVALSLLLLGTCAAGSAHAPALDARSVEQSAGSSGTGFSPPRPPPASRRPDSLGADKGRVSTLRSGRRGAKGTVLHQSLPEVSGERREPLRD